VLNLLQSWAALKFGTSMSVEIDALSLRGLTARQCRYCRVVAVEYLHRPGAKRCVRVLDPENSAWLSR